jgi:hypothetical protein
MATMSIWRVRTTVPESPTASFTGYLIPGVAGLGSASIADAFSKSQKRKPERGLGSVGPALTRLAARPKQDMHVQISSLIALLVSYALAVQVVSTQHWDIGTDIQGSERLNGVSYQEDVLVTFGDYQYVTFYNTAPAGYGNHYVNVGRRRIRPSVGSWQFLTLTDYLQTTLDGHNMISLGISGDGKIHLSFDHHVSDHLKLDVYDC